MPLHAELQSSGTVLERVGYFVYVVLQLLILNTAFATSCIATLVAFTLFCWAKVALAGLQDETSEILG